MKPWNVCVSAFPYVHMLRMPSIPHMGLDNCLSFILIPICVWYRIEMNVGIDCNVPWRHVPLLLYSYQLCCRPTNSHGCYPEQQLMNKWGMNSPAKFFSSDKQVATGMIMISPKYWVWTVHIWMPSAGRSLYVFGFICACMPLLCSCCVFVCILCSVKAYASQVFTDFNDWVVGLGDQDLLLLTEGVKGMKLTFAFHPDSRWTANLVFIFVASGAGIMMWWLRHTKEPRHILKVSVLL